MIQFEPRAEPPILSRSRLAFGKPACRLHTSRNEMRSGLIAAHAYVVRHRLFCGVTYVEPTGNPMHKGVLNKSKIREPKAAGLYVNYNNRPQIAELLRVLPKIGNFHAISPKN